jgi:hypothetical protein
MALTWKDGGQIRLLDDAVSQVITVNLFDEIKTPFTATAPAKFQFINVVPDLHNKILFLRPIQVWTAK